MTISKKEAREWAEYLIQIENDQYEFSSVYEDEEISEKFPDEADQIIIYKFMMSSKVSVTWDD